MRETHTHTSESHPALHPKVRRSSNKFKSLRNVFKTGCIKNLTGRVGGRVCVCSGLLVGAHARTHMYHIRRVACVLPISKCETFEVGLVHFLHCAGEKKTCVHTPATSNNNSHIRCGGARVRDAKTCVLLLHMFQVPPHTHVRFVLYALCAMAFKCGDAPAPAPAATRLFHPSQCTLAYTHTRIDKPNFLPHLERRRRARAK